MNVTNTRGDNYGGNVLRVVLIVVVVTGWSKELPTHLGESPLESEFSSLSINRNFCVTPEDWIRLLNQRSKTTESRRMEVHGSTYILIVRQLR